MLGAAAGKAAAADVTLPGGVPRAACLAQWQPQARTLWQLQAGWQRRFSAAGPPEQPSVSIQRRQQACLAPLALCPLSGAQLLCHQAFLLVVLCHLAQLELENESAAARQQSKLEPTSVRKHLLVPLTMRAGLQVGHLGALVVQHRTVRQLDEGLPAWCSQPGCSSLRG